MRLLQKTQESSKLDKGKIRSLTESLEIARNHLEDSKVAVQNALNNQTAAEERYRSLEHQVSELNEELERMKAQLEFSKRESDASNSKVNEERKRKSNANVHEESKCK